MEAPQWFLMVDVWVWVDVWGARFQQVGSVEGARRARFGGDDVDAERCEELHLLRAVLASRLVRRAWLRCTGWRVAPLAAVLLATEARLLL